MQDTEIDLSKIVDDTPAPDRNHERQELIKAMDRIIKTLPSKYRSILYLYYYEDMQYEEISEMTGMPLGTVKSHLHRAKEKVNRCLSDAGLVTGGN